MQSCRVSATISQDGGDAAALLADQPARARRGTRPRRSRCSSRRACPSAAGCGSRCSVAVGREARQQEARQARRRLREHEERVAHRRGEEPLVADQLVERARRRRARAPSRASCSRARRSRPASRSSPCRSVLPRFRRRRDAAAVVVGGDDARQPLARELAAPARAPARTRRSSSAGSSCPGRPGRAGTSAPRARRARPRAPRRATRSPCTPCCDRRAPSAGGRPDGTRPRRCDGRSGRTACSVGLFSFAGDAERHRLAAGDRAIGRSAAASAHAPPSRASASRSGDVGRPRVVGRQRRAAGSRRRGCEAIRGRHDSPRQRQPSHGERVPDTAADRGAARAPSRIPCL